MWNSDGCSLSARKISAGIPCSSSTAQLLLKDVVGAQRLILADQESGESGDCVSPGDSLSFLKLLSQQTVFLIYQHPSNEISTRNTAECKNYSATWLVKNRIDRCHLHKWSTEKAHAAEGRWCCPPLMRWAFSDSKRKGGHLPKGISWVMAVQALCAVPNRYKKSANENDRSFPNSLHSAVLDYRSLHLKNDLKTKRDLFTYPNHFPAPCLSSENTQELYCFQKSACIHLTMTV